MGLEAASSLTLNDLAIPIRRHLPFYESSADVDRYRRLRRRLSLYRLAFGQANQDDLLDELEGKGDPELDRRLAHYMLNLAPFRGSFAWNAARLEAARRLTVDGDSREWVERLCRDSENKLAQVGKELGADAVVACGRLIKLVQNSSAAVNTRGRADAAAALVYFRNPFDDRFDIHREVGLQDDARRFIQVASRVCGSR